METPDFWAEPQQAQKVAREAAELAKLLAVWQRLGSEHKDLVELLDLTEETAPEWPELAREIERFLAEAEEAELKLFLSGDWDSGDALLTIHVGAGGVDAADWAEMLLRMYLRFAERQGWRASIAEMSRAEPAGIKSATVRIEGPFAFGYLKSENGAHRLVRKSPFNSAASRETSFAKVEVLPIIDDASEIAIDPKDLRIDTYGAGGAGGQHVNKTESAVRITHLPTGLVAASQNERSQHQNREQAMSMLRAKLALRAAEERAARERELRGEPPRADFGGDAIRSYVLDDRRVKDKRTGYEEMNPDRVLDGDLLPFIRAMLQQKT